MVHCSQLKEWKGLRRRPWVCSPKQLPLLGMTVFGSDPDEDSGIMPHTAADWSLDCGLTSQPSYSIFFVHLGLF